MIYDKQIIAYYTTKMVANWNEYNFSKSPSKPKYFMRKCLNSALKNYLKKEKDFLPFSKADFYMAHAKEYVDAFFGGEKLLCESNGLQWSEQFASTICYTNASLYHAIRASIFAPEKIHVSPTCGFHHAQYNQGFGYCTFSGQVIASLKIYNQFQLSGCYIDLDGHFGNSIEDSRKYCKDLNEAIPLGFNINPRGKHAMYIKNLINELSKLEIALLENKIHYVVYCHGADSHEDDDLGFQLTTEEWLKCTTLVCEMIGRVNKKLNRNIPFTYCLFGGYREDDYNKVIDLHYQDLELCFNLLTQSNNSK